MPHYSQFQRRDDFGQWSGGFIEDDEPQAFADGGRVEDRAESRGLAAIPRHVNAFAGMADYALGGLPSTAVGAVHGLMPGGPGYGDVKAASEAALDDFRGLYPSVADPMLEMMDNPMGAGFFGLPAFLRRASRGLPVAERLAKANAELDKANAELKRLGKYSVAGPRPIGGWKSADDELAQRLKLVQRARTEIDRARRQGFERTRDIASGNVQRALPAPSAGDYARIEGPLAEMQPDDLVITRWTRESGRQKPAAAVRRENHPLYAPDIERQRQQRARDEFRRNLAIEDELTGGPVQRALLRQDQNVDEFVSNLLGQYRRQTMPDLPDDTIAPRMRGVERFIVNEALDPMSKGALGDPLSMREIVRSMMRRGYGLPGMNMSVLQDRDRGRFKPYTPAEREFKTNVKSISADPTIQRVLKRIWRDDGDQ